MKRIGGALTYVGFGAILYLLFVGAHLDFASAWTLAWLLAWPFMLVGYFFYWLGFALLIMGGGVVVLLIIAFASDACENGVAWVQSKWKFRKR